MTTWKHPESIKQYHIGRKRPRPDWAEEGMRILKGQTDQGNLASDPVGNAHEASGNSEQLSPHTEVDPREDWPSTCDRSTQLDFLLTRLAHQWGLGISIPAWLPSEVRWQLLRSTLFTPAMAQPRQKLAYVNTLEDVVGLLQRSKKILVLTGAGISVSCGIPDFRSENGIYARLGHFNLPDPQCMFDINYFRQNPAPFFSFSRELLPGNYRPSVSHLFIRHMEERHQLLRCYTQNIDSLELAAGLSPECLLQCHGSFGSATCLACRAQYPLEKIRPQMEAGDVPRCTRCFLSDNIVKPDIVFFGESLGDRFSRAIDQDEHEVDLLIVMGSSLKVGPVNRIMQWLPKHVPQILINRELVGQPNHFDVELLGNCDSIVMELCTRLGWTLPLTEAVDEGVVKGWEQGRGTEQKYECELPSRYLFVDAIRPERSVSWGRVEAEHEEGLRVKMEGGESDREGDEEEDETMEQALYRRPMGESSDLYSHGRRLVADNEEMEEFTRSIPRQMCHVEPISGLATLCELRVSSRKEKIEGEKGQVVHKGCTGAGSSIGSNEEEDRASQLGDAEPELAHLPASLTLPPTLNLEPQFDFPPSSSTSTHPLLLSPAFPSPCILPSFPPSATSSYPNVPEPISLPSQADSRATASVSPALGNLPSTPVFELARGVTVEALLELS